jgi:Glycosyl hydrolase family 59
MLALAVPVMLASSAAAAAGRHTAAGGLPVTSITLNANGSGRIFDGVGAVLGGGGNARYLMDYAEPWRDQILDYLFKPKFGAALQLLKLEIGGGANSSDGSEPSIDPAGKQANCGAGYELAIAQRAVALNPALKLYGLQWSAPGWVSKGTKPPSVFTMADIGYLIDWLRCARKTYHLAISYLGGWNESDKGNHATWYGELKTRLKAAGFGGVQIVAADTFDPRSNDPWPYASVKAVNILGNHDPCDYPTGNQGPNTACKVTRAASASGKPLWASELGAMDAGAQTGCTYPCAPAMDRATVRGYITARLTGYLEWPALDAMPAQVLPFENRGLVTAVSPGRVPTA